MKNKAIKKIHSIFYILLFILIFISCKKNKQETNKDKEATLFSLIDKKDTGIDFFNKMVEDLNYNFLFAESIYNGGGVGIIDLNKDEYPDVLLVNNQGQEKLYLNKGDFKFEDISTQSGIKDDNSWSAGVCIADVNNDGWEDIYILNHLYKDKELRRNKLYINNRNNTFTERSKEYGIDDSGYSIHANFFDFDLDGDLDLLVVNQPMLVNEYVTNKFKIDHELSSHLYQNNENKNFTDITANAGLLHVAFSLSASIADYNNDGYPDIYFTNDYDNPDTYYTNNRNGTFTNRTKESFKHISQFSMGSDVADINNDGELDIVTVDMVSEDHYRNKANMSGMNPQRFWKLVNEEGYAHQYMFNSMHLNQGTGVFSEIAQLSGIDKTDWSWAPLMVDFDCDGYKDLFITNGYYKDVRNKDAMAEIKKYQDSLKDAKLVTMVKSSPLTIIEKYPSVKLKNYIYKNKGNLEFENKISEWGLSEKNFSNGASYADLDNDGDMDLIINNLNDYCSVMRNNLNEMKNFNYLKVKLIGTESNTNSFGARVITYLNNSMQLYEFTNARGFISTSEQVAHFGFDEQAKKIDSILVRWPSGKFLKLENAKLNQLLTLKESEANQTSPQIPYSNKSFVFTKEILHTKLQHIITQENNFDDYKYEVLMPHKMSTLGPCTFVGDINSDKLDDIYIGGAAGYEGKLFIQKSDGDFVETTSAPWKLHKDREDSDILFYDIENDGDLDIYVASGSNEFPENSEKYQDRIYRNEGNLKFSDVTEKLLPKIRISTGVIKAFDMDGDRDLDLFVGGRQVPGKYGKSSNSLILKYENGKYIDRTHESCQEMTGAFGLVQAASYIDIEKDGDLDLVVTGEWMPLTILVNDGKGNFRNESKKWNTQKFTGWWNCIAAVDINRDGKIDFVTGNLGKNIKFKASQEKPMYVYLDDFDKNGTWDTYLGSYDHDGKLYPVRGRQCSSEQMPFIKEKFKNFDAFAKATLEDVLEGKQGETTLIKNASEFQSGVFMNNGSILEFIPFPNEAQISPIQDFVINDFNLDGEADILYGGNYHNREVETTRSDAGVGGILLGKGDGSFNSVPTSLTGLKLDRDLRKIRNLKIGTNNCLIVLNNNSNLQTYLLNSK